MERAAWESPPHVLRLLCRGGNLWLAGEHRLGVAAHEPESLGLCLNTLAKLTQRPSHVGNLNAKLSGLARHLGDDLFKMLFPV
jgi:hypothetical protein